MKRCTKCILPETFPGIKFDNQDVCNYCKDYQKIKVKRKEEFEKILSQYQSKGKKADCIAAFSGGRDSCFMLYKLVKDFKIKVLAVTDDWGLMTPEAHRNWERTSKILGIEHIILKNNTDKIKRDIRKNIRAWLKRPHLGMVPILTQGDKQLYYHIGKIAKQRKIPLVIICGNPFEVTMFKTGFFGVYEQVASSDLSKRGHLKLLFRYLLEYFKNPGYINISLIDAIKGYIDQYITRFLQKTKWINFYDYIRWDEKKVLSTIRKELNWESPKDTTITWRTDDATAPLYNYLHYVIVGFTENDTFRSNQIREGVLTREKALKLTKQENRPRIEAINQYFKIIKSDMDFRELEKRLKPYQLKLK